MKTCTSCGQLKSLEKYGNKKASPDGHNAECKICLNRKRRARAKGFKMYMIDPTPAEIATRKAEIKDENIKSRS